METVPLSGDAIEFLQRRDTCLTHNVANVWRCVCFGIEPQKVKRFSLAYSFRFSVLHAFHFLFCLSPFSCFPLFIFSPSFLFLPFCLVSFHLVSFCLPSVLLYSIRVFHLLANMSFFPSFLNFFFTFMSTFKSSFLYFFVSFISLCYTTLFILAFSLLVLLIFSFLISRSMNLPYFYSVFYVKPKKWQQ